MFLEHDLKYSNEKTNLGPKMQHIDDSLLIISQLINNKSYFKRIMHHLDPAYFEFELDRRIFKFIKNYANKYSDSPTPLIMQNALSKLDLTDEEHNQYISEYCELVNDGEIVPLEPLLDKTEEYIKDMELKIAISKTISIYKGDGSESKEAIPEILRLALSKSIEDSHGEFYFNEESAKRRLESYRNTEAKIPFKIKKCNEITHGGIETKGLHYFIAAPNVGKSAWLISLAADYIKAGIDVLYVTCEMSIKQIGIRFDAHFMNKETYEVPKMDDELFFSKLREMEAKYGKLIIKDYPTNELTSQKLDVLLDELYTKTGFRPKVVMVDYLGICSSYRLKDQGNLGTYYTKVAEEFRASAQAKDYALWSAGQMTTDALDNTDPGLKHIGYGQGAAKTADLLWFGIRTEELDALGQMLIKQEKTRYHKDRIVRFVINFDIGHMRMGDADVDSIPMSLGLGKPGKENRQEIERPKISTAFNNIKKKS